jgi:hypothetical protein
LASSDNVTVLLTFVRILQPCAFKVLKFKRTDKPIALTGTIEGIVRDLRGQGVKIGRRSVYPMFDERKREVLPELRAVTCATDKCDSATS